MPALTAEEMDAAASSRVVPPVFRSLGGWKTGVFCTGRVPAELENSKHPSGAQRNYGRITKRPEILCHVWYRTGACGTKIRRKIWQTRKW
ncbi:MAG TPA: hypothetical protein DCZ91_25655 [Lachnospiraceae bacterium]|nr:hypothetical protein [Lachnospiraceae bacterium]